MARDWNRYFIKRFSDKNHFVVDDPDEPNSISDATGKSETTIETEYVSDTDHEGLWYVFLDNPHTPGWNSYWSDVNFDPWVDEMSASTVEAEVESMLAIGLHHGWTEKQYFCDGDHVKSLIRWESDQKTGEAMVYMEGRGCLLSPFLAIRYSAWFAGDRMGSRTVVVEPMIGASPPLAGVEGEHPVVETSSPPMSGDAEGPQTFETSPAVVWVGIMLFLVLLLILLRCF